MLERADNTIKGIPMLKTLPLIAMLSVLSVGCGPPPPSPDEMWTVRREGIVHNVEEGETLWSIARLYGMESIDIYENNEIEDVRRLEPGRKLFIPGATEIRKAPLNGEKPDAAAVLRRLEKPVEIESEEYFVRPTIGPVFHDLSNLPDGEGKQSIDIYGVAGTDIIAAKSGKVAACSSVADLGNVVVINHGSSERTLYGYLRSVLVYPGQMVSQGETIGRMGVSPRTNRATLHFRIYRDNEPIDPTGRFSL